MDNNFGDLVETYQEQLKTQVQEKLTRVTNIEEIVDKVEERVKID